MGFQPVRARNFRLSRLWGLASLAKRETILDQTAERSARFARHGLNRPSLLLHPLGTQPAGRFVMRRTQLAILGCR